MQNKGFDVDFIDKLKSANDIVSVISKYVTLQKKGKTYWGCCPFHFEKTPSFAVNEIEQYYHCFGCGESGDVIKFVEKIESLDFMGAINNLAEKAGMEVPKITVDNKVMEVADKKKRCYQACNLAMAHYESNLPKSKVANAYLVKRELGPKEVEKFHIGYSDGWTNLIDYLNKNNVSRTTMLDSGVAATKDGKRLYDVMAERLIFPIINSYGDCIGFTARALGDQKFAKYRNTEQTVIFDKSRTVYNINNVKKYKQEHGLDEIIICEGSMDVIAMVKAGFENTVACMGTAITSLHARELKRFASRVILCLDGDFAGQKAAFRALDILMNEGLDVRVVTLPENLDPDEFLKKYGADKLREYIANADVAMDYKIKKIASRYNLKNSYENSKFIKEVLDIIKQIDSKAEQEIYLKLVRDLSHISIDVLRRDIDGTAVVKEIKQEEKPLYVQEQGLLKATKFILASILHKKDYASTDIDYVYFKNPNYQKLYDHIKNLTNEGKEFIISEVFSMFDVEENKDIKDLIDYNFEIVTDPKKYYAESLNLIRKTGLEFRQEELKEKFKTETDTEKRRLIAIELTMVTKELKK